MTNIIPIPAAQRAMAGSTGESSVAGGSGGNGVGIFSVDLRIVVLVFTGAEEEDADEVAFVVTLFEVDESGVSEP